MLNKFAVRLQPQTAAATQTAEEKPTCKNILIHVYICVILMRGKNNHLLDRKIAPDTGKTKDSTQIIKQNKRRLPEKPNVPHTKKQPPFIPFFKPRTSSLRSPLIVPPFQPRDRKRRDLPLAAGPRYRTRRMGSSYGRLHPPITDGRLVGQTKPRFR